MSDEPSLTSSAWRLRQRCLPVADCFGCRSVISLPEKFLFIREYVSVPVICSLSKCPVDITPPSSSHLIVLISPAKISQILPEIVHVHARFPALYLPLLPHSIIHKVIAPLAFLKHTVPDSRCCVFVVFSVVAHDNPLPSCPWQASVRFNRLTCCRGETGSQRGWCVGGPRFRPEDQHLIGHSLTFWSKSYLSLLCADQRTDKDRGCC